jgi:hypothetical protein
MAFVERAATDYVVSKKSAAERPKGEIAAAGELAFAV